MTGTPLLGPAETLLPDGDTTAVRDALVGGTDPLDVAARYPAASLAWAELAGRGLTVPGAEQPGGAVPAYAYARVGYHRGLDALRRAGWRGAGPVPWRHEPNQGFLRCLHALAVAAERIGESAEAQRCRTFLDDCDPTAAAAIESAVA